MELVKTCNVKQLQVELVLVYFVPLDPDPLDQEGTK